MSDTDNLQWTIGDVTVTRVFEQGAAIPAGGFFPMATQEVLAEHFEWLKPWPVDENDHVVLSIHALCVEADGHKMIVDTCVGQRPLPEMFRSMSNDGSFLKALADAGFAREDVDFVICTHMHFDHVGWNTMLEGDKWVPTFPNARYLLSKPECEHWNSATEEVKTMSSAVTFDDAVTPLFDFDVVDLVEMDHRVSDTIEFVPTPGHSPGHVSVRISSQGESALITGDCVHSAVQLAEPDWHTMVDTDGDMSSDTRRSLIAEYADQPVLIIGTHFPPPTAGHLVTTEKGVRFQPLK